MYVHRCRYTFSMRQDNDEDDEDDEVVGSQLGWRYRREETIVQRGRKRNGTAGSIDGSTRSMTGKAVDGCAKRGGWRQHEDRRRRCWHAQVHDTGLRALRENAERLSEH